MEWQANALAPRIQIPIAPFKKKMYELIHEYCTKFKSDDIFDFIEPLINGLAMVTALGGFVTPHVGV